MFRESYFAMFLFDSSGDKLGGGHKAVELPVITSMKSTHGNIQFKLSVVRLLKRYI